MNRITDHEWEYKGIDGAVQNDWCVLPAIILSALILVIMLLGVDNVIEVVSDFIVGIRAN